MTEAGWVFEVVPVAECTVAAAHRIHTVPQNTLLVREIVPVVHTFRVDMTLSDRSSEMSGSSLPLVGTSLLAGLRLTHLDTEGFHSHYFKY